MNHKIFNEIKNSVFSNMIFQPTKDIISPTNMFVINFTKEHSLFSFHIFCSLRVLLNNQILLTGSDEFISCKHTLIGDGDKSLVEHNIKNVKSLAKNMTIKNVEVKEYGDVILTLSNEMVFEIRTDCLLNSFEFYRLFDYNDPVNKVVVLWRDGNVIFEQ